MIRKFKIKDLGITDKAFNQLPFGRQIEYNKKIAAFKANANERHISQKRKTHAKAWREFIDLYEVEEYYAEYEDSDHCRDDTFQVWYTKKKVETCTVS